MNKSELVSEIAAKAQVSQKQADAILDAAIDTIVAAVSAGERVMLVGFGSFEAKERQSRAGHNPRTGELITIAATKVPAFSAGQAFKSRVALIP